MSTAQTSMWKRYCIDACAILDFWGSSSTYNRVYDVDVSKFREIWEYIKSQIENNQIILPKFIYRQLEGTYRTELKDWLQNHTRLFIDLDSPKPELETIVNEFPKYTTEKESIEDAMLVALAKRKNFSIITSEARAQHGDRGRIKIPNVCEYMNVECNSLIDYMRREGL